MGPPNEWVKPLDEADVCGSRLVGSKGATLAKLKSSEFKIPRGFCILTHAYDYYKTANGLESVIQAEFGRKALEDMRWEEMWDAALRIRSAFLSAPIPPMLVDAIMAASNDLGRGLQLAVRSSAPGEDSRGHSFAGLHESFTNVKGDEHLLDSVRLVWASLWSDAAILYRNELALDPGKSTMGVVVLEMIHEDCSGVLFGRDPMHPENDHAVIEAVTGPCSDLVDGAVKPDHWIVNRGCGDIISWLPGDRESADEPQPLLGSDDIAALMSTTKRVEDFLGFVPDVEWTGRQSRLCLLQARPITSIPDQTGDERIDYLRLRPSRKRLLQLCHRVSDELIPRLADLGEKYAQDDLATISDGDLADAIQNRLADVQEWRTIYKQDFIPFAHGVRQLGQYYNDAVRPDDPYEFVGLLQGERMVAVQRNEAMEQVAHIIRGNPGIRDALRKCERANRVSLSENVDAVLGNLVAIDGGHDFVNDFKRLLNDYFDVSCGDQRLCERPDLLLAEVLELAERKSTSVNASESLVQDLECKLFAAAGPERHGETEEILRIARLSWRLRDDDNILMSRLESQLLRAVADGARRLQKAGRLTLQGNLNEVAAKPIIDGLKSSLGDVVLASPTENLRDEMPRDTSVKPRQLVGQPASPGLATGLVQIFREIEDYGRFRSGQILVCDAIQPMMTHLVPLASAIIERRGGMLIHGAIIARELGIPCVNGIADAAEILNDGDIVTVDGNLGIVTIGEAEFRLELE